MPDAAASTDDRAASSLTITFRFANGPVSVSGPPLDCGERGRLLAAVRLRAEDAEAS